jgi:hypothetical protein
MKIEARQIWKSLVDEDSTMIVDRNDVEPKVVKVVDAQNAKEVLSFMASEGSQKASNIT